MTIASTNSRNEYSGDCSRTVFPYTFRILDQSHVDVYVACVLKTISTHYTVSGVDSNSGGNITIASAPNEGELITIVRSVPITQTTDYVEGSRFPADSHEDALDKLTMIAQMHDEELGRAVKLPITSTLENIDFPVPGASSFVRWNAAGTALETATITATGVATATLAGSTRAALGTTDEAGTLKRVTDDVRGVWMSTGSGYFAISGETVNVKEFGAKGDGTTDDSKALEAAFAVGGHIIVPAGVYLTRPRALLSNSWLQGAGPGRTIIKAEAGLPNNSRVINICNAHDVMVSDIEINGNGATAVAGQQNHNILIRDSCQVWVHHVVSRNAQGSGISVTTTHCIPCCSIWITDNVFTDAGRHQVSVSGVGACYIWIARNHITRGDPVKNDNEGGGIDYEPSSSQGGWDTEGVHILDNDITEGTIAVQRKLQDYVVRHVIIRGNRIDSRNLDWQNPGNAAINLSRIQDFIVDGNVMTSVADCRPAIRVTGLENRTCVGLITRNTIRGYGAGILLQTCTNADCLKHMRVTDNWLTGTDCSGDASLVFFNVENLIVQGNMVQGELAGHGIALRGSQDFVVAANIIDNAGGAQGINLAHTASRPDTTRGLIYGNIVRWSTGTGGKIGIATSNCAAIHDISIFGNDLACTETPISLGGSADYNCNVFAWGNRTCSVGVALVGATGKLTQRMQWNRAASVADGGTITHGLGCEPTVAFVQATTSGEFASVTAVSSTTITLAIKKHDNSGGTTQPIYWMTMV